jgi:hypothetical protein
MLVDTKNNIVLNHYTKKDVKSIVGDTKMSDVKFKAFLDFVAQDQTVGEAAYGILYDAYQVFHEQYTGEEMMDNEAPFFIDDQKVIVLSWYDIKYMNNMLGMSDFESLTEHEFHAFREFVDGSSEVGERTTELLQAEWEAFESTYDYTQEQKPTPKMIDPETIFDSRLEQAVDSLLNEG